MADIPRNGLVMGGAVVAVIGVLAFAIPVFTTSQTTEVAKIGDLRVTAREQTAHSIPPMAGPAAIAIGLIMMGAGFFVRR